jgi:hypothetical protein
VRKNVASQHVSFALVVASTGAALVGATPAGYLSKDGGGQAALIGSFTGLGNGQYDYAPTQAETNANELGFLFTAATAVPVGMTIYTTAADPSNAASLGLTNLDAAVTSRATQANILSDATPFAGANIALIQAKTTNLPASPAAVGSNMGSVASVTADVGITQAGADKVWSSAARTLTAFSTALALSVWDVLLASIATAASVGLKVKNWVLGADSKVLLSSDTQTGVTIPTVTTVTGGALDATVAKEATLNTKVPTALSFSGANVQARVADKGVLNDLAAGAAMTLTAAYDAAKTAAQAGDAMTLTAGAIDAILDDPTEGSVTMRQIFRVILAFVAGKANGAPGGPVNFRDQADTKNRIVLTNDANGNRTAVTVDGT